MKKQLELTSLDLHVLAMSIMLLDHAWATVISGNQWMTFVGRVGFPIFAFLIAEGYHYTHDFRAYFRRMLLLALLSEIPFNLMMGGSVLNPFHQNVIWTFLIALVCLRLIDRVQGSGGGTFSKIVRIAGIALLGFLTGTAAMVDYYGTGVLTVILFHLCRGSSWKARLGQFLGLYLINFVMIQNMDLPFWLFGHEFFFPTQGFAIFSLVFLWLYRGRQGRHSKAIQMACYAFYPVHILILSLLALAGV